VTLSRRGALSSLAAAALAGPAFAGWDTRAGGLFTRGRLVQGGTVIGRAAPGAAMTLDGQDVGSSGAGGWFVLGFDRDAAANAVFETRGASGPVRRDLSITPGTFVEQRIDGLPEDQVAPTDPALLERIKREVALKAEAFASHAELEGFADGFIWPLKDFKISSPWGVRRILNGVPKTPHYGIDLAAATGTPIHAPAPGLVVLAEPDMHFEGGLTLIDHGQGLVSMYLHQSKLVVTRGERVERDQLIGEVGMKGRATGPHLCWRMKWRGRNCDPSLLVDAPQAA
jgi:murein DD-endopeptidase MepM/ murein hydrolase activator NlpD